MASVNAGPITGSELLRAIQGSVEVWLTRPQVAALLASTLVPIPRVGGTPTAFTGKETFRALQKGSAVRLSAGDLSTFLAGSAAPDSVPASYAVTSITGREVILGVQTVERIGFTIPEVLAIRSLGGGLALTYSDGTPLTYSDGVYLEYSA